MSATAETVMLVKVSSTDNNNKFYEVQLAEDGTVKKRWGRVGTTGQSGTEATGRPGFEKLVNAKQKKGYKPVAVVGSAPAQKSADTEKIREISRLSLAADPKDSMVATLIDRLVAKNRHEIVEASGGLIKVNDDGVITTPLGIIEPNALKQAEGILTELEKAKNKGAGYKSKLEEYLTLVPQKLPSARGWEQTFFDDNPIAEQIQFLKQLQQSYEWYETEKKAAEKNDGKDEDAVDYSDFFRYKLRTLDKDNPADAAEFKRILGIYKAGIKSYHPGAKKRLHRIWEITDRNGTAAFDAKVAECGNVKELWHGSSVVNVLSLLRSGFLDDPNKLSTVTKTGAMFGPSVYFSSSSSKSLSYSIGGVWSGTKQTDCFMLLNEVVCGKEFVPKHYSEWPKSRKNGYASIHADHRSGVKNHEQIVWETSQIKMKYLCEFR